jgi:hypothetical protein
LIGDLRGLRFALLSKSQRRGFNVRKLALDFCPHLAIGFIQAHFGINAKYAQNLGIYAIMGV